MGLLAFLPARNLGAGTARFGEADGDRLLAAFHALARAAALQLAALHLVHRTLDLASCLLAVASGHRASFAAFDMRNGARRVPTCPHAFAFFLLPPMHGDSQRFP